MKALATIIGLVSGLAFFTSPTFAACPSNLDDSIAFSAVGDNYLVEYTNDSTDGDFFGDITAQNVANALQGSHQRYVNLGFNAPFFNTNPNEVCLFDSSDTGGANFCTISIDVSVNGLAEPCVRLVSDHEGFHHVQYSYINNGSTSCGGCGGTWGKWTCEGSARMMQDALWDDLDANAGCITFLAEINQYLASPNTSLTNASYKAALWWQYARYQLGTTAGEPQRGVDFIETFWSNTDPTSPDSLQVLRDTIADYTTRPLEDVWQDFTIANYTKDLDVSMIADASRYAYVDETNAGQNNPGAVAYDQVARTTDAFSAVLKPSSVNDWAARYFEVDIDPGQRCDIVGFRGETQTEGRQLGWTFIGITAGNQVRELRKERGSSFYKAFINDPTDPFVKVAAVVTGLGDGDNFDYAFVREALDPKNLEILRPTFTRQAYVGEHADPDRFLLRLNVTGPSLLTPDGTGTISVKGLSPQQFTVFVENASAQQQGTILNAAYVGGQYWITVQAPVMDPSDGTFFNVRVCICEASGDCIVQATNTNAIVYAKIERHQMVVIDRSGSMTGPSGAPTTKMDAAKAAAALFVDVAADDDRLGVASFNGDGIELNDDATLDHNLQVVAGNRLTAQSKIFGLIPGGLTSIGDGMEKAQDSLTPQSTPASIDHIILLSDGQENEDRCWSGDAFCTPIGPLTEVRFTTGDGDDTIVDAIAFGPTADQALMQDIATTTDGDYFYVDVSDVSPIASAAADGAGSAEVAAAVLPSSLELTNRISNVYLGVAEKLLRKQRLFSDVGNVLGGGTRTVNFEINEADVEMATLSVSWSDPKAISDVTLSAPGVEVPVERTDENHWVFEFKNPVPAGSWSVNIKAAASTQVLVVLAGKPRSRVAADLYLSQLPGDFAGLFGSKFLSGLPVTLLTCIGDLGGPVKGADVLAQVAMPDGSIQDLPLFDDGAHDDGNHGDGCYGNVFTSTLIACGNGGVPDDSKDPGERCSYVVQVAVRGVSNKDEKFTRELNRAFQVYEFEQEINPDEDKDELKDRWEALYGTKLGVFDRDDDPDRDDLTNFEEQTLGTDPLDPDTDDGGVLDGTEVRISRTNPLDPRDDTCPRPGELQVITSEGDEEPDVSALLPAVNSLRFSLSSAYTGIRILRGDSPRTIVPYLDIDPLKLEFPGIYFDKDVELGKTYFYQIQGICGMGEVTPPSPMTQGTPKEDPVPPRGYVIIAEGPVVPSTMVTLLFDTNPDNEEVMVSNDPLYTGGKFQPNPGKLAWELKPGNGNLATVYARYRDRAGNVSDDYSATARIDEDDDLDDDRIPNAKDNCPTVPNTDQSDEDGDEVGDVCDNCRIVKNPNQRDTNIDGYGNFCDPDFDNNLIVNAADLGFMKTRFFSTNPDADLNGDGAVNAADLSILKRFFFGPPGPSGLVP